LEYFSLKYVSPWNVIAKLISLIQPASLPPRK
jgi:hypothetical protein